MVPEPGPRGADSAAPEVLTGRDATIDIIASVMASIWGMEVSELAERITISARATCTIPTMKSSSWSWSANITMPSPAIARSSSWSLAAKTQHAAVASSSRPSEHKTTGAYTELVSKSGWAGGAAGEPLFFHIARCHRNSWTQVKIN